MKSFFIAVLALLLWALIFVSTMPLQFAADKVKLPEDVQISHLRGSIWSGGANITYKNQFKLLPKNIPVDFVWRWCPRWEDGLLVICVEASNPDFNINGLVAYSPWSRQLLVQKTSVNFALAWLDIKIPVMNETMKPVADVLLTIEDLRIHHTSGASQGTMTGMLNNLQIGFLELGDYSLRSNLQDQTMLINYAGKADEFKLDGDMRINFSAKRFEYDAGLVPDNTTYFEMLKPYAKSAQGKKLVFAGDGVLPF